MGLLRTLLLSLLLLAPPLVAQEITDLDQLLEAVRQQQAAQREQNRQREQQFLAEKRRQQTMLDQARRDFQQRQRANQPLLAKTEANRVTIEQLQARLQEAEGDVGNLAATFREFAGDFQAVLHDSLVSAQLPERRSQLDALAAVGQSVGIEEIESLWLLLQEEMTEAGKLQRFEAPVIAADGAAETRSVLRVGTFSAFSDGEFLRYVPQTGELLAVTRQPAPRYRAIARDFSSGEGLLPVPVDPTRGSLLGVLGVTPNIAERIEQGGTIALIIIGLGALGLLLALWRGVYLGLVAMRIRRQLAAVAQPRDDNPLGRILLAVQHMAAGQEELLQLKLEEAVLAELPALERGNGLIKLLAATSPLLGLLGTVTGMILTFQAISLFGTGDPKLMAGGISQALVTTVLGLVVAIPLLFAHSVIAYLARNMIQHLDEQSAGVLARAAEAGEG